MNKTQPFLLLVSSLTLLGCSQIGSGSDTFEAPTGSEVGKEVVTAHYAKALEAMNETKAIGANLAGSVNYVNESSSKITSDGTTEENSWSSKISVSDINVGIAVSTGEQTKASMKASANYSCSSSIKGSSVSSESDTSISGKASVAAYLSDNTLYADLTGLSDLLVEGSSSAPTSLKRKTAVSISTVDWSDCADYLDSLAEKASKSEYLQVKEGTYSFVYTIDPSSSESLPLPSKEDGDKGYTGEFKAWLSFTEEGFTEAGISGSVKYENAYSFAASDGSYSYDGKMKLELTASLKATFSYGSSVKVEEVTDPNSYVDVNASVD